MSMAEVIKSFHFYFLSNDAGLLYDYPDDDYSLTLLGPIRAHLERHGAEIVMGKPVGSIRPARDGYLVGSRKFDYVVLAADVKGVRAIADRSKALAGRYPSLGGALRGLRSSNRYAVLRLWADRDVGQGVPGFVITDHDRVLDSISFYHRLEKTSAAWAQENGGGIYELHSYAVPDEVGGEAEIRERFLQEFADYFPETRGMRILGEHLQVRDDFTAFHTGMHAGRPGVETEAKGLFLAGDWVRLPRPAMLMEAACMSGLLAANGILRAEGLREEQVYSVPPRGVLARP
jgi:isorenieratene synthase